MILWKFDNLERNVFTSRNQISHLALYSRDFMRCFSNWYFVQFSCAVFRGLFSRNFARLFCVTFIYQLIFVNRVVLFLWYFSWIVYFRDILRVFCKHFYRCLLCAISGLKKCISEKYMSLADKISEYSYLHSDNTEFNSELNSVGQLYYTDSIFFKLSKPVLLTLQKTQISQHAYSISICH